MLNCRNNSKKELNDVDNSRGKYLATEIKDTEKIFLFQRDKTEKAEFVIISGSVKLGTCNNISFPQILA